MVIDIDPGVILGTENTAFEFASGRDFYLKAFTWAQQHDPSSLLETHECKNHVTTAQPTPSESR